MPVNDITKTLLVQFNTAARSTNVSRDIAKNLRSVIRNLSDRQAAVLTSRRGVSASLAVVEAKLLGTSVAAIAGLLGMSDRTLRNRLQRREKLARHESAAAILILEVWKRALGLFDKDEEAARSWLNTPAPAFEGATPLSMLDTPQGALEVIEVMTALEHGMYV